MPRITDLATGTPAAADLVPFQPSAGATKAASLSQVASGLTSTTNAVSTAFAGKQRVFQVDVKDAPYNATGNGTTDDTAAIQAAIDAAVAAGGGLVRFPPGTYKLATTFLTYGSNVILRGTGSTSVIKNATSGKTSKVMLKPTATGITNVLIENLVFDQSGTALGYDSNSYCVSVNGTTGVTIRGCVFTDIVTMAVWADTTSPAVTARLSISDCHVTGSQAGAFSFFGNVSRVVVSDNIIENCKDDGVAMQQGTGGDRITTVSVTGNVFYHNNTRRSGTSTPHAVMIFGAKDVSIVGNTVDGTVADAICVQNSTSYRSENVVVSGNSIRDAGITVDSTAGVTGNGVKVLQADGVSISGNTVIGSRGDGIYSQDSTVVSCVGNVSRLNGLAGIEFKNTVDGVIASNTCMDNGTTAVQPWGVLLNSSNSTSKCVDITVEGNRCGDSHAGGSKTQAYGAYIAGSDTTDCTFVNNDLTGNATGAKGGVAGSGNRWRHNRAYNPVGVLGPPSVPATTVAYTNAYTVDAVVHITGGTVTVIAVNGVTTGLTSGSFLVPAGSTITLTYSSAPTWVWIGQ